MKYLSLILLISFNLYAETFKYQDIVNVISNLTEDDKFFKCNTHAYVIEDINRKLKAYLVRSIDYASGSKCDKLQPETNLKGQR